MKHFIKNDAHTPNITLVGEFLVGEDLGGSVEGSAQKGQLLGLVGVLHHPAEAKVAELGHSLLQQYVSWLYIPMDDTLGEQRLVPLRQMPHEGLRLSLTEPLVLTILLEITLEIAILAVFQDHIDVFPRAKILVEFDDEGRFQCSQIFDLIFDLLFNTLIDLLDIDALDCHLLSVLSLPVEDGPCGASTQGVGFEDSVVSHFFDHLVHH